MPRPVASGNLKISATFLVVRETPKVFSTKNIRETVCLAESNELRYGNNEKNTTMGNPHTNYLTAIRQAYGRVSETERKWVVNEEFRQLGNCLRYSPSL